MILGKTVHLVHLGRNHLPISGVLRSYHGSTHTLVLKQCKKYCGHIMEVDIP